MFMLKIMSGEDRPDSDVSKSFKGVVLGDGVSFEFSRLSATPETETAILTLTSPDGTRTTMELSGNAYVVSNTGKTVASFAYSDTKLVDNIKHMRDAALKKQRDETTVSQTDMTKPLNMVSVSPEVEALTSTRVLWLKLRQPARVDQLRLCTRRDGSIVVNDLVDTVRQLDQWCVPNTYGELLSI